MTLSDLTITVQDRKKRKIYGLPSCIGEIQIGEFKEKFIMPLNEWTVEDYENQWRDGIDRLEHNNVSCLVATVQNLKTLPFVNWWVLYKKGKKVVMYNQILLDEVIRTTLQGGGKDLSHFDAKTCYSYIPHKKPSATRGEQVSSWEIMLS